VKNTQTPTIGLQWPDLLRQALARSPAVQEVSIHALGAGALVDCLVAGEPHRLLVECLSSGQPRHVRSVAAQLLRALSQVPAPCQGVVVAPFLSPASRAILETEGLGWLDLAGNVRVAFPRFHLEVAKADQDPLATRRVQRSLFYPKSARLLKLLLSHPGRSWRVTELADAAGVSLGQVSNVRKVLVEREWAAASASEGLQLVQPGALLDAWRDAGLAQPEVLMQGYTLLHGQALQKAMEDAFEAAEQSKASLLLAGASVARRAAPYLRVGGEFFYADDEGLAILKDRLQLQPASSGANVTVYGVTDDGLWMEAMPLGPVMVGTGRIQTYLDLCSGGERSREAAEHWRQEMINKLWEPA
jgi:hypothetical protein